MLTHKGRIPLLLLTISLILMLVVTGCGSPAQVTAPEEETPQGVAEPDEEWEGLPVFTLEELAEYDGRDGRPAYVAVDGLVYDFTELERWAGGEHFGYQAGTDLTEALHEESPHGDRVMDRAPVVGRLAE